ncbi:MAG TPA: PIN domain-containing protein [Gaiellaceae bacterium]|nr:PIN domain-containing protein [Gaiellaceae bacterium]
MERCTGSATENRGLNRQRGKGAVQGLLVSRARSPQQSLAELLPCRPASVLRLRVTKGGYSGVCEFANAGARLFSHAWRGRRGQDAMLSTMLPRPGINVSDVVVQLNRYVVEAFNSPAEIDSYVNWVLFLEVRFDEWFTDVPPALLYSERFWRLTDLAVRTEPMILRETARVVDLLKVLRDTLDEMVERFASPSRYIAVLDTNVLLHHKPVTDVLWTDVVGESRVTLAIPVRVLDEMDAKKAANNQNLRDRASKRVNLLAPLVLAEASSSPVREGVDLTVVGSVDLDPDAKRRPAPPVDVDVLDTCVALRSVARTNAVFLVTGDLGMAARARWRGIDVRSMPENSGEVCPRSGVARHDVQARVLAVSNEAESKQHSTPRDGTLCRAEDERRASTATAIASKAINSPAERKKSPDPCAPFTLTMYA